MSTLNVGTVNATTALNTAAINGGQLAYSQVNKAAWATYRQALRDLPANTPDPANPVWPQEP